MQTPVPTIKSAIYRSVLFVTLLWLIKSSEQIFGFSLREFGVYPNDLSALTGILTAPLIHGSYEHLFSNTLPTLLLGTILFYGYPKTYKWAVAIIWLSSGIGVWLFAREAYHVGASGLTHGIFFYLLLSSILRRDKRSIALMMIAFFMYGSMILTILPREQYISFEYHLFGAIAGVICALLFYNIDPKPVRKKYAWENEDEADEEPNSPTSNTADNKAWADNRWDENDLIGDEWKLPHQREAERKQIETESKKPDSNIHIWPGTTSEHEQRKH